MGIAWGVEFVTFLADPIHAQSMLAPSTVWVRKPGLYGLGQEIHRDSPR
jgi:hypothetical protein